MDTETVDFEPLKTKLTPYLRREGSPPVIVLSQDAPEWMRDVIHNCQEKASGPWVLTEVLALFEAVDTGKVNIYVDWEENGNVEHSEQRAETYSRRDLFQWAYDHCLTELFAEAEREDVSFEGGDGHILEMRLRSIMSVAIHSIIWDVLEAVRESDLR